MAAYRFKATGRDGKPKQGIIQAESQQDAEQRVLGRGWTPLLVQVATLERSQQAAPPPSSAKRTAVVFLVLLLLLALATFAYLDPWNLLPFLRP